MSTSNSRSGEHTSNPPDSASSINAAFTPSVDGDASSNAYDLGEPDSAFKGDSSVDAHTAFASEFLEHAVEKTSLRDMNPSMSNALHLLQQMVNMQNQRSSTHELRFPHAKPLPRGGLRDLAMPPVQLVVSLLRDIKGREQS